jgi:hypothetical protein
MIIALVGVGFVLSRTLYAPDSVTLSRVEFLIDPYCNGDLNIKAIIFYVQNSGVNSIILMNAQVNGTLMYPETTKGYGIVDTGQTVPLGTLYNWSSGERYTITIITPRGTFSFTRTAVPLETDIDVESVVWDTSENTTSITLKSRSANTCEISDLGMSTQSDGAIGVTESTSIGAGIAIHTNETVTIALYWPNEFATSWIPGTIYTFIVHGINHFPDFDITYGLRFNSTTPS